MDFLKFDAVKCTLCGKCIDKCPFGTLRIEGKGIAVGDTCLQFTSCMKNSECIVAINSDPDALIFKTAHYCIVDDLYQVVPRLTALVQNRKED